MQSLKIIIADDQPLFRSGLETAIRNFDSSYNVLHACNGREVLEIIKNIKIDIIFMDILMLELNGSIGNQCTFSNRFKFTVG